MHLYCINCKIISLLSLNCATYITHLTKLKTNNITSQTLSIQHFFFLTFQIKINKQRYFCWIFLVVKLHHMTVTILGHAWNCEKKVIRNFLIIFLQWHTFWSETLKNVQNYEVKNEFQTLTMRFYKVLF